jgi:aminoglycoside 6'-N-acetyltransferase I
MRIRAATLQDIDLLVRFEVAMLQDMASYGGMPLAQRDQAEAALRRHLEESLRAEACLLLAIPDGEEATPRGMLDASIQSAEEVFVPRRMIHVHAVYVEPGWRRRGVGRELLEAALAWGRQKGCLEADLNVLAGNPARGLYEGLGFQVFEVNMRRRM